MSHLLNCIFQGFCELSLSEPVLVIDFRRLFTETKVVFLGQLWSSNESSASVKPHVNPAYKESRVPQPGASGFCDCASEFFSEGKSCKTEFLCTLKSRSTLGNPHWLLKCDSFTAYCCTVCSTDILIFLLNFLFQNKIRAWLFDLIQQKKFEVFIMSVIMINMITMMMEHNNQTESFTTALNILSLSKQLSRIWSQEPFGLVQRNGGRGLSTILT